MNAIPQRPAFGDIGTRIRGTLDQASRIANTDNAIANGRQAWNTSRSRYSSSGVVTIPESGRQRTNANNANAPASRKAALRGFVSSGETLIPFPRCAGQVNLEVEALVLK